jgi:hypothetical protein
MWSDIKSKLWCGHMHLNQMTRGYVTIDAEPRYKGLQVCIFNHPQCLLPHLTSARSVSVLSLFRTTYPLHLIDPCRHIHPAPRRLSRKGLRCRSRSYFYRFPVPSNAHEYSLQLINILLTILGYMSAFNLFTSVPSSDSFFIQPRNHSW